MIGSPSNLELLLHCYYSSKPHPWIKAPALMEGTRFLINHGMIRSTTTPNVFDVTEKGEAYIDYLMKVPFPEPEWIVPEQKQKP